MTLERPLQQSCTDLLLCTFEQQLNESELLQVSRCTNKVAHGAPGSKWLLKHDRGCGNPMSPKKQLLGGGMEDIG